MPGTDAQRKAIAPGIVARVSGAVRYALTGNAPDEWFGPSQPIGPQAQAQAQGRQFDYPVAFNTRWVPRADEGSIQFDQLRALADNLDLVRLAIETRKDQMCKLEWKIAPKDVEASQDNRCLDIQNFLAYPDREHDWQTWLRMVLEDLFVIDAPTIYPRATKGGGVYSLDLMDGATIKRIINPDGRTPEAPQPAYQQILKGVPAADYHRDELLYLPRNPRTWKVYGYGPVEQIITTVNIALRRQISQLSFYSYGSTPDLIFSVPKEWNPDQVRQFKDWWDSLLAGNLENRRGTMFVPEGVKTVDTKEGVLKDDYDEWLARIVCFAFSLPPSAFVKQMNRATAETAQEVAQEEGLAPIMQWTAGAMNRVLARWFNAPDLQFQWNQDQTLDQLTQAQIDQIYVTTKVITPDEVRENLGMEPLTAEQQELLNPAPPPMLGQDGEQPPGEQCATKLGKKKTVVPFRRSTAIGRRSRNHATHSPRY